VKTDLLERRHARIAWRCRRGMRELDLLLERVLAQGLGSFESADLDRLEHLLEQPDQDILAWLTHCAEPEDADTERIVAILRKRMEPKQHDHE
jgi:antitoxin CptB